MIHLRGRGTDVVVDLSHGAPEIVHWGAPLSGPDGTALEAALERPRVHAAPDTVAPVSVVPEHGSASRGGPGCWAPGPTGAAGRPGSGPPGMRSTGGGSPWRRWTTSPDSR